MLAEAPQPPQHVRDVAAEHAAQGVELVDDHVAQPQQEVGPARVRREDPHVQHLGVREDHVGVLAGPGPVVGGGVAVVGDGPQPGDEPRAQRTELVLGERLRREHEQRGVATLRHDRFDDRELVAERLPRRGAGRDDDVPPARRTSIARPGGSRARRSDGRGAVPRPRGAAGSRAGRCDPSGPGAPRGTRCVRRARDRCRGRRAWSRGISGRRMPSTLTGGCRAHVGPPGPTRLSGSGARRRRRSRRRGSRHRPSWSRVPVPLATGITTFFTFAGSIESASRPRW